MISEGQRNDITFAIPVLEQVKDMEGSRVLTDRGYDKLACTYLGFLCIASILICRGRVIIEFKVKDSGEGKSLEDTADAALKQIEEQRYQADLEKWEISEDWV